MGKLRGSCSEIGSKVITSDEYRMRIQTAVTCLFVLIVGLIMFIINIFTQTHNLMIITGCIWISAAMMFTYILIFKKILIPRIVMGIIVFGAMIMFLYDGGIEGFSPYWTCIVPAVSIFVYGTWGGICIGTTMLGIIIIMLWSPVNANLAYDYSTVFVMRFPMLYLGAFLNAVIAEIIRYFTFLELKKTVGELEKVARIDELTRIENRHAFEVRIQEIWELFLGKRSKVSLLMIDIDYFKKYNDFYGHLAGDKVLKRIAEITAEVVQNRKGYVSRWGGEEFVCLLPFYGKQDASSVARDIIKAVRAEKISHEACEGEFANVSVSIGVATANIGNMIRPEMLIEQADQSLYEAKHDGRNRVGKVRLL